MLCEVFLLELNQKTGGIVDASALGLMDLVEVDAAAAAVAGSGPASAAPVYMPDTVSQMQDRVYQTQKLGYKVDTYVNEKATADTVYMITAMGENVKVAEVVDGVVSKDVMEVKLETLLSDWKLYKGKVFQKLPGWNPKKLAGLPSQSLAFNLDVAKGAVALAMNAKCQEYNACMTHTQIFTNPMSVKVLKHYSLGEFKLVGASMRIEHRESMRSSNSIIVLEPKGRSRMPQLYANPHFVPHFSTKGEPNKAVWMAPFLDRGRGGNQGRGQHGAGLRGDDRWGCHRERPSPDKQAPAESW